MNENILVVYAEDDVNSCAIEMEKQGVLSCAVIDEQKNYCGVLSYQEALQKVLKDGRR